MTRGYGLAVNDIDMSCPNDLKPYAEAHKIELRENDSFMYNVFGSYGISALMFAIEHCLAPKQARIKYLEEPILHKTFENDGLTQEEIDNRELQRALLAEQQWQSNAYQKGLPPTIL
jgi:hypothetical protein